MLLVMLIASGTINSRIAKTASLIAGKSVNGTVEIGKIEGNLLSKFSICDISVKHDNDTILKLDQFEISYKLSHIIQKNIFAELIRVNGMHLFLREEQDGNWNFQKLLPAPDTIQIEKSSTPLDWHFQFPVIELNNITVDVDSNDKQSPVPKNTKLNASLNFEYSVNRLSATLVKFNLISKEPELRINQMTIETALSDSLLSWKGFELNLPATHLVSKGSIPLNRIEQSEIDLNISPLAMEDLSGFIKGIYGKPEIKLQVSQNGSLKGSTVSFSLTGNNQSLTLNGNIFETDNITGYKMRLETNNINAGDWTRNPGMDTDISGYVQISGESLDLKESNFNLNAEFAGVQYNQYKIENLVLYLNKSGELFDAVIDAITPWGKVNSEIKGQGSLDGSHNVTLIANINSIDTSFSVPFYSENFRLKSTMEALLSGTGDSLHLDAGLKIDTFVMDKLSAGTMSATLLSDFSLKNPSADNSQTTANTKIDDLLKGLSLSAVVNTGTVAFGEYNLDSSFIHIKKINDNADGSITIHSPVAKIATLFEISEIFDTPVYRVDAALKNADISKAILNENYSTDLNFDVIARGEGVTPGNARIGLNIKSYESSAFGHELKDINSTINIENDYYELQDLNLETPFMVLDVSGKGNIKENHGLSFLLKTKDTELLAPLTGIEPFGLKGEISGEIRGFADSLNINTIIDFNKLKAGDLSVEKIVATANFNRKDSVWIGSTNLRLDNTQIKDIEIKQLDAESIFNKGKVENTISFFASDSLNGKLKTGILFRENLIFDVQELYFKIRNNEWKKADNSSTITLLKDSLLFSNVEINSNNSYIKIEGALATRGYENFNFEVSNVKLLPVPGFQILPFPVSGTVNGLLNISGTAEMPAVSFEASAGNLMLDNLQINEIRLNADYDDDKITLGGYIEELERKIFEANAELPVKLSIADRELQFNREGELTAIATVDQLDLGHLNAFIPLKGAEAAGSFSATAEIKNSADNPQLTGSVSIDNGTFRYDRFGVNYKDIGMRSNLTNNNIALDSLKIHAGKGNLNITGSLEPDTLYNGSFKNMSINITGDNFRPLDSDLLRAEITTDIHLTGSSDKPVLGGKLIINQANLNTDLFLKEFDRVSDNLDEPLLTEAREKAQKVQFHKTARTDAENEQIPVIMENLSGEFDVEIPGNTWIKGKNMNFEINGLIKAVIQNSKIDLFGSVSVKRGYYKLYGKRLDFEEGEVTLTGGEDINPQINFNIAYRFRDVEDILRKLNITVTGRVSKPQLSFSLDGAPIQEKDAISYLLFNKSSNQLDSRESSSIQGSNLDLARDLALGQLSNVVKDALQSSLGLDVIEISGEEGWSQGSVSIGKYITNNLFLSYQRTFALDKKNKQIEPEKISLEYQLLKSLFLQATNQGSDSGFDFIFKWTWK